MYVSFPFVLRAVQPVFQDMEEAAKTLGAKPFAIFRRVILPTITPAVLTGAALSFSRAIGEFTAVDDVTFQVEQGELVALLGPSRSGKSTILRIIAGLENPDRGEIYLT
jgi:ABC-type sulfate transport system permease subunit